MLTVLCSRNASDSSLLLMPLTVCNAGSSTVEMRIEDDVKLDFKDVLIRPKVCIALFSVPVFISVTLVTGATYPRVSAVSRYAHISQY